ncbi:hypothetical protein [Agromyces ramosus]|uniref:Uncharacterized protein n=1 Tax=Agromyces ramosus TaxID=33879 RepID=A0ABU0R9N9_9MICO|nr:hypothetical protein [Agromyces ramosus]MDQ0894773.1 hypothetical protein [Agromyces ramosus]
MTDASASGDGTEASVVRGDSATDAEMASVAESGAGAVDWATDPGRGARSPSTASQIAMADTPIVTGRSAAPR